MADQFLYRPLVGSVSEISLALASRAKKLGHHQALGFQNTQNVGACKQRHVLFIVRGVIGWLRPHLRSFLCRHDPHYTPTRGTGTHFHAGRQGFRSGSAGHARPRPGGGASPKQTVITMKATCSNQTSPASALRSRVSTALSAKPPPSSCWAKISRRFRGQPSIPRSARSKKAQPTPCSYRSKILSPAPSSVSTTFCLKATWASSPKPFFPSNITSSAVRVQPSRDCARSPRIRWPSPNASDFFSLIPASSASPPKTPPAASARFSHPETSPPRASPVVSGPSATGESSSPNQFRKMPRISPVLCYWFPNAWRAAPAVKMPRQICLSTYGCDGGSRPLSLPCNFY